MRKVKKKEKLKLRKRRRREKRKREGEKEENETEMVKRRCEGLVSVDAFEIFSQGGDVESCGDVSWEDLLDNPEDLSDCEPDSSVHVRVVLVVTDVLVSLSSVVTEFCVGFSFCLDWDFVDPQYFFFLHKACSLWNRYAGRDEVRRLTSESTSAFKKKDDTAYTYAKFVYLLDEGPRKV